MKILIANDDGIFAPGIKALSLAFSQAGHEVIVCAPDSQRSAASHSLTIGRPLAVREAEVPGAARAYAIGGTPADCVKLGLTVLCPEAEAVVSGVNHGYNAGSDVLYSGTVAAALEGAICGRPALAVSQSHLREEYASAAEMAVRLFQAMMEEPLEPMCILNLNYPAFGEAKGLVCASAAQLYYDEQYTASVLEDGAMCYVLQGEIDAGKHQSNDYAQLEQGYATVTVLHADLTDHAATGAWKRRV